MVCSPWGLKELDMTEQLTLTTNHLYHCIDFSLLKLGTCSFDCMLLYHIGASPIAQSVKNPPAMWETQVQFLGWEDPLEKEMSTHSIILVWKISWTEKPGGLQAIGLQRVRHDGVTPTTKIVMRVCLGLYL